MLYAFLLVVSLFSGKIHGLTFPILANSDVVGHIQTANVKPGETLPDIGRRFEMGIYEMQEANPEISLWLPPQQTPIIIPSQFLLPIGPRNGMVINLTEMRIYFYHPHEKLVSTYPIGIGKKNWHTPIGNGSIVAKTIDPIWTPPSSIRSAHEAQGRHLPTTISPGPKNPLGKYSMRLSIPGYLIHGTNRTGGIGVRSSSGCIRMHPEDIENLFPKVSLGSKVTIVHQPYKIGQHQGAYLIEYHAPLSDDYYQQHKDNNQDLLQALNSAKLPQKVSYTALQEAIKSSRGYPIFITE